MPLLVGQQRDGCCISHYNTRCWKATISVATIGKCARKSCDSSPSGHSPVSSAPNPPIR